MNIRKELKKYLFKNLANIVTIIGFLAVIWLLVINFNHSYLASKFRSDKSAVHCR